MYLLSCEYFWKELVQNKVIDTQNFEEKPINYNKVEIENGLMFIEWMYLCKNIYKCIDRYNICLKN